jgi:ribose transport system substrate-binding protein
MSQRSISLLLVCVLFASVLIGCKSESNQNESKDSDSAATDKAESESKQITIAMIPKGTTHEFWKSVHAGAVQAVDEFSDGNVTLQWEGPLNESDREGQISKVENFIVKGVQGICLAPLDSQALVSYVEKAKEKNIPVVIFDSGLDGDPENYVAYVATDNFHGGVIAADRMAEALKGKGNVILLRYTAGSKSTEQREEGFLDQLKKKHPGIKVISSDQYAETKPEEALTKATQLLNKYKGEVNGIFAVCEPVAAGTLRALEETELLGKVHLIAFDPNEDLVNALGKGNCSGIVLQDPVKMGYNAVKAMLQHLNKEEVEKRIVTGEYVATPENMKTPEMDKLLHPAQFE